MNDCQDRMMTLGDALRSLRLQPAWDEYEIHRAVGETLSRCGINFVHEAPLAPRCRCDFLIGGSIVLEIKRGRPTPSALRRQLERYAACPQVEALVLLAEKQVRLPRRIGGKACYALSLSEFWGVAL